MLNIQRTLFKSREAKFKVLGKVFGKMMFENIINVNGTVERVT